MSNTTHVPDFADSESSVRDTATGQFAGTVSRPGREGCSFRSGLSFLSHPKDPICRHLLGRPDRQSISLTPLPTIHQPTARYAQPSETSPTQADPKCNHCELPLAPEEQVPGILQRDGISAGMLCSMPPLLQPNALLLPPPLNLSGQWSSKHQIIRRRFAANAARAQRARARASASQVTQPYSRPEAELPTAGTGRHCRSITLFLQRLPLQRPRIAVHTPRTR